MRTSQRAATVRAPGVSLISKPYAHGRECRLHMKANVDVARRSSTAGQRKEQISWRVHARTGNMGSFSCVSSASPWRQVSNSVYPFQRVFQLYTDCDVPPVAPASFCKCTCFTNSTIIPLSSPSKSTSDHSSSDERPPVRTCNDCTKQFCLDYNLPICRQAKEDDVFTTCFQRDSRKDQAVVFLFIFATGGLLIWASVRPWAQKWMEERRGRGTYTQVNGASGPQ
nr:hypothetical protein CFP56_10305 [Quercus suber]